MNPQKSAFHRLLSNGFLHGLLLPLAWLLPVHGLSFAFHASAILPVMRGFPGDPRSWFWRDVPEYSWIGLTLGFALVAAIAFSAVRRLAASWERDDGIRFDGFWRGFAAGLLVYLALRQVVSYGLPEPDPWLQGLTLSISLVRAALSILLAAWIVRSALRSSPNHNASWWRSGFVHAAIVVLVWMTGTHLLWWHPGRTGLDAILFSDSASWWEGLPLRTERGKLFRNIAWMVCAAALLDLLLRNRSRARRRNGARLESLFAGTAFGFLLYLCLQQFGATYAQINLDLPLPWHAPIWNHLRLLLAASVALLVLLAQIRRVHGSFPPVRTVLAGHGLAMGACLVGLVPASTELREASDWYDARTMDTIEEWNRFVQRHPQSRRLPDLQHRVWTRVKNSDNLLMIREYLAQAKNWGIHLDSARLLEAAWYVRCGRKALQTPFSSDPAIDVFWRSRLPDTAAPYAGSAIVRYELIIDEANIARDAARLRHPNGLQILQPSDSFDLTGMADNARPVETALDSVVHSWATPLLVTVAPATDTARQTPRLRIRVRPRLTAPLEPVPCEPGCPPDGRRFVGLPSLAYDWTISLRMGPDSFLVTRGTALDTSFAADWLQSENCPEDQDCRWTDLGLQGAWERRRDRSLNALAQSIRRAWRIAPAPN